MSHANKNSLEKNSQWKTNGLFITLEGGDGSGKTTQIQLLKKFLEEHNYEVVITREPGGTIISEAIRNIILDKNYMEMTDITEALLYAASRAQHVEQFIRPNLEKGNVVISDRFVDSSIVYQGYARGLGMDKIREINNYATGGLLPNLTILLDVSNRIGLERKKNQKILDRLELQKKAFHDKVMEGFRVVANENKDRMIMIDASQEIHEIHDIIQQKVMELMN